MKAGLVSIWRPLRSFGVVYAFNEPMGTWNRVIQILIRSQHLSLVQLGCIEQIIVNFLDCAVPTRALPMMSQKTFTSRVTVIIEGDDAIRHVDVVPQKPS